MNLISSGWNGSTLGISMVGIFDYCYCIEKGLLPSHRFRILPLCPSQHYQESLISRLSAIACPRVQTEESGLLLALVCSTQRNLRRPLRRCRSHLSSLQAPSARQEKIRRITRFPFWEEVIVATLSVQMFGNTKMDTTLA